VGPSHDPRVVGTVDATAKELCTGQTERAPELFERLPSLRNDLGLLAQEFDSAASRPSAACNQCDGRVHLEWGFMDLGLKDRVYIVTGGTRGLGRAGAEALVADGARLVLASRSQEAVDAAVQELGPAAVAGLAADNADPETPERLVAKALDRFGRLDGALVSVGGPRGGRVTDLTDDEWRAAFESVFLGAVRLARVVAGQLSGGGALAFVLSSSVKSPISGLAASNGLRPGLAMVIKQLADELGPNGIRAIGLLPASIETDRMRERALMAGRDPEQAKAAVSATIPLRRYGQPNEFGRVAAFMLSPAASYVSGSMIAVDGGALRAL
jgi:3-oxoacyl-[acyl-carrier protein] reductase